MPLEDGEVSFGELPGCLVKLLAHFHTAILYWVVHLDIVEETLGYDG